MALLEYIDFYIEYFLFNLYCLLLTCTALIAIPKYMAKSRKNIFEMGKTCCQIFQFAIVGKSQIASHVRSSKVSSSRRHIPRPGCRVGLGWAGVDFAGVVEQGELIGGTECIIVTY